jgi:hypothetical protein
MSREISEGISILTFAGSRVRHLTWAIGLRGHDGIGPTPTAHLTFCGRAMEMGARLSGPVTVKLEDTTYCSSCLRGFRYQVRVLQAAFAPKPRPES